MKNYMKVNHKDGELVMDKTFAKKSELVGSAEYNMLQAARRDYPTYTVITKTNKKNKAVEHYDGLTYDYMERYIASHENAEKRMAEYQELRLIAECHSVRYHHIKNWFLEMYPEVKQFGVKQNKEKETNAVCVVKQIENGNEKEIIEAVKEKTIEVVEEKAA